MGLFDKFKKTKKSEVSPVPASVSTPTTQAAPLPVQPEDTSREPVFYEDMFTST